MILFHPYIGIAFQIAACVMACLALAVAHEIRSRSFLFAALLLALVAVALGEAGTQYRFRHFPEIEPTGISIWQDTVNKSPEKLRPRINLARAYQLAAEQHPRYRDLALQEYNNAKLLTLKASPLERRVTRNIIAMNVGDLLVRQAVEMQGEGRPAEAMDTIEQARQLMVAQWQSDPGHPGVAINLGKVFVMVGHAKALAGQQAGFAALAQAGVQEIRIGIEIFDAGIVGNYASATYKGIDSVAVHAFPDMDRAYLYFNKAEALRILGDCDGMRANYALAGELDPDMALSPACP